MLPEKSNVPVNLKNLHTVLEYKNKKSSSFNQTHVSVRFVPLDLLQGLALDVLILRKHYDSL